MSELKEKKSLPRQKARVKKVERELTEKEKSKRLARKIVITMVISCVVLLGLNALSTIDFSQLYLMIFGQEELNITFAPADFDENILIDPDYLDLNRKMALKTGGQIVWIGEDSYGEYDEAVNRMHEYFKTAIMGNRYEHHLCFTEDYLDDHEIEPFTMQRIYDMQIEQIGQIFETKDGKQRRLYYLVEYKIQKNNGTFRDDVGSDGSRAQVFELILNTETNECLIDKITLQRKFKGVPVQD